MLHGRRPSPPNPPRCLRVRGLIGLETKAVDENVADSDLVATDLAVEILAHVLLQFRRVDALLLLSLGHLHLGVRKVPPRPSPVKINGLSVELVAAPDQVVHIDPRALQGPVAAVSGT